MDNAQEHYLNDSIINNTLMDCSKNGETLMPVTLSKTETILHIIFISQVI